MNEDDVVITPVPSLLSVFLAVEQKSGVPLARHQALGIRDMAPSIALTPRDALALAADRGYRDVDGERCWDQWQQRREELHHPGLKRLPSATRSGDLQPTLELAEDMKALRDIGSGDMAFVGSNLTKLGEDAETFLLGHGIGHGDRDKPAGLILCVPGPWENRSEFIGDIVRVTGGEFLFAGLVLSWAKGEDHIRMEFEDADPRMAEAFTVAGQGRIEPAVLRRIEEHRAVAYLHFPMDVIANRERILRFTDALCQAGGLAVKVETCGIAHCWKRWRELLSSEDLNGEYCAFTVLVGDDGCYYTCGMHHFSTPDSLVSWTSTVAAAAELLNGFNFYQINERPQLASGHTFSLSPDAQRYRLSLQRDRRHKEEDLFHNPYGVWHLARV